MSTATSTAMTDTSKILDRGRRVLRLEREAIAIAEERLGEDFAKAVSMIAESPGRVIVCGVGKSGLIGRKIAATLTSTGTPAMFLHPVEGAHGDLGIVGTSDIAILISKSGESEEILTLLEQLKRLGVRVIAITGNIKSALAVNADLVLDGWVREEACPHDLAPTTSTTVTLALGDALAIALLEERGFAAEDFARLHPGGALGRKMLTRVRDVMENEPPVIGDDAAMRDVVVTLAQRRGITIVTDAARIVLGVVTAGDLARLMQREQDIFSTPVASVMTRTPKLASADELGSAVVHRMEQYGIMAMPVVNESQKVVGVIHLHDLMRAGVV